MVVSAKHTMVQRMVERAYRAQQRGQLRRAALIYRASLRLMTTAEAWAGLGWIHGQRGELCEALQCSQRAIEADPELGNPYSEIGACLIQMQRFKEAVPWFRRAAQARRYAGMGSIFLQLGGIQERLGEEAQALQSYGFTLAECPSCPMAQRGWERIVARRN